MNGKEASMDVRTAVINYGKENGYDGLYNEDIECGCTWDDFCPCGSDFSMCVFGYAEPFYRKAIAGNKQEGGRGA